MVSKFQKCHTYKWLVSKSIGYTIIAVVEKCYNTRPHKSLQPARMGNTTLDGLYHVGTNQQYPDNQIKSPLTVQIRLCTKGNIRNLTNCKGAFKCPRSNYHYTSSLEIGVG